jgi:hypothetical protein
VDAIRVPLDLDIAGRRSITNRFRKHLFERAVREPFAWVAGAEKVSGYRVVEAFDAHAAHELVGPPDWFPRVRQPRRERLQAHVRLPHRVLGPRGVGRCSTSSRSAVRPRPSSAFPL